MWACGLDADWCCSAKVAVELIYVDGVDVAEQTGWFYRRPSILSPVPPSPHLSDDPTFASAVISAASHDIDIREMMMNDDLLETLLDLPIY